MLGKITSSQKATNYSISSSDYRQYSRYTNNLGTLVEIELRSQQEVLNPKIKGLIINDSLGGCSVIAATTEGFQADQICWLRTDGLNPIKVKIIWVEELETNIFRLGIEYLSLIDRETP